MKIFQSHQQLNLTFLITVFLLVFTIQKSNAQCNISFLSYQSNYISEDSLSICYNFTSENSVSNDYQVFFNNKLVRTATYENLDSHRCITINKNDFGITNELLVQDMERLSCSKSINVESVFDVFQSGDDCYKNFSVEKTDCFTDGSFYIELSFTPSYYPEDGSFTLFSNNQQVGEFQYKELPLMLGPYFDTNQIDFNFTDTEYFCGGNVQVYTGACLLFPQNESADDPDNAPAYDPGCSIAQLNVTQVACANEERKTSISLNFVPVIPESENFYLFYYNDDLSTDSTLYKYADLPIEIGNLNGDGYTSYGMAVADADNPFCRYELFLQELSCVLPGNTNGDLNNTVNHIDLLKIGEAYGKNGPARADATVNPTAQIAESWNSFFNDGWNYKHADCNGDGLIDIKDALIIKQNYSKKSFTNEDHKYLNFKSDGIPVGVEMQDERVKAFTEIKLPIMFGDEVNIVDGLYGIAFSLNIDTNYIDVNDLRLDVSESWLNNDEDELLSIFEFNEFDSQLNVSLTKTNCQSTSGFGNIANLRLVIIAEIEPEKRANDFQITVEDVVISDKSSGFEKIINKGLLQIKSKANIVTDVNEFDSAFDFKVYPTPATEVLNINSNTSQITDVVVYNLIGVSVYKNSFFGNTTINVENWLGGIYYVHLKSGKFIKQKKILVE